MGGVTRALNRDRLAKVLALMASPVDGEALATCRMAVKLLADAGMRPEQLVDGVPMPVAPWPAQPATSYSRWAYRHAATPTRRARSAKPRQPSVRDMGPAELRQVLDDLLGSHPFPLLPKHAAFVRDIRDRLYREPHLGLSADDVRRLNGLWRAWLDMQMRIAA